MTVLEFVILKINDKIIKQKGKKIIVFLYPIQTVKQKIAENTTFFEIRLNSNSRVPCRKL